MTRCRIPTAATLAVLVASLVAAIPVQAAQAAPGDLDPTFSDDGMQVMNVATSDDGRDVTVQRDGKIVVVGGSWDSAKGTQFGLTRFNANGSLDTSFDGDGKVRTESGGAPAVAVAMQLFGPMDTPVDKIVAAGGVTVARYNPDGSLDTSFAQNGRITTDFGISDVEVETDAMGNNVSLVLAGYNGTVARYSPDGSPDLSFGKNGNGKVQSYPTSGIALHAGKIVVVGSGGFDGNGNSVLALARYDDNGSPDASFGTGGSETIGYWGEDVGLSNVAIGPDGTIATVGASYCFICSSTSLLIAVFGPDGSDWGRQLVDVSGTDTGSSVAIGPDGNIVAVGATADNNFLVARYWDSCFAHDGAQITDFGGSDGAAGVAIQPDGKIVVAGNSVVYGADGSATSRIAIARYQVGPPPPAPTITSFTPTSGAAGSSVDIVGLHFTGASMVAFQGPINNPGAGTTSFTLNSDTELHATVPPGAIAGPISVTTNCGGTGSSSAPFTPTTGDTTPPQTTITSGPSATTTASSATFQFSASEPSSFACSIDAAAYSACVSPITYTGLGPGSHSFAVRATDTAGNADPTPAQQTWTVQPNAPPTAQFSYNCTALTCNFDASASTDSDGTIQAYKWGFGDGNAGSGRTVSHTYARPGSTTVSLTVTDNAGATAQRKMTISSMTLTARGYRSNRLEKVDLSWTAGGASFDIYRNGTRILYSLKATAYTDNLNKQGSGTYSYKVCAAVVCSNTATVRF
jgi:uncharacterized delta-60 repeat protein